MNATEQAHGDRAAGQAIEPTPKGRFGLRGITLDRAKPKVTPALTGRIGPPAPRPLKFRDGLPTVYLRRPRFQLPQRLGGGPGYIDATERPRVVIPPRERVDGGPAWVRYYAQRGIVLTPTADRHTAVQSRRKLMSGDAALIAKLEPLTLPALLNEPPPDCNSAPHPEDVDRSAVTIGVGGSLLCSWHLAGGGAS